MINVILFFNVNGKYFSIRRSISITLLSSKNEFLNGFGDVEATASSPSNLIASTNGASLYLILPFNSSKNFCPFYDCTRTHVEPLSSSHEGST